MKLFRKKKIVSLYFFGPFLHFVLTCKDNVDNAASFFQHYWVAVRFADFSSAEVCSSNPKDCVLSICCSPCQPMSLVVVVELEVLYFDSLVVERMVMAGKRVRTYCCILLLRAGCCCWDLETFSSQLRL